MNKNDVLVKTALLAIFLGSSLFGARPQVWTLDSQAEFLKGESSGVSVTSDGVLLPAPGLEEVLDTQEAIIHSAVADSSGAIYFGTGTNGKIFRLPAQGEGKEWAKLEENGVFALAVDSANRIYAGTSPEGKVYQLDSAGKPRVFFNPNEKYIWALAVDAASNVYVATGPKGIIYKVDPQGNHSVFFDGNATHIVSLTWDLEGNLLAGSAPDGLLFRISKDGKAFVLYDSAMEEMKAITVDRYGNIYAAALTFEAGDATPASKKETTVTSKPRKENAEESRLEIEGVRKGKKLEVYKIDKSSLVDVLYTSDDESAFDLLVRNDGSLEVATGNKGRVLTVTPQKFFRLLVETPDDQVTRLIERSGSVYLATGNLGKVYKVNNGAGSKSSYESDVLDGKMVSSWGKIRWQTETPSASPRVFTRSGNTEKPDKIWSDWKGPYQDATGSTIESPSARYLQWKVEFSGEAGAGGGVTSVSASYLQRNMAPKITRLTVHAANSALIAFPTANPAAGAGPGGPDNAHLRSLPAPVRELDTQIVGPPPRQVYVPGARSISWAAEDPNEDDLVYAVYYRGENEKEWMVLKKDLMDTYLTMDGASFPDGRYLFKVVASDSPSNPADLAQQSELVSRPFVVSNAPPLVELSKPQSSAGAVTIDFTTRTTSSFVYQAEYSLSGGDWKIIYPADGIADSGTEKYEFKLESLARGEYVLAVRVIDSVGNIGTGKTTITVP